MLSSFFFVSAGLRDKAAAWIEWSRSSVGVLVSVVAQSPSERCFVGRGPFLFVFSVHGCVLHGGCSLLRDGWGIDRN